MELSEDIVDEIEQLITNIVDDYLRKSHINSNNYNYLKIIKEIKNFMQSKLDCGNDDPDRIMIRIENDLFNENFEYNKLIELFNENNEQNYITDGRIYITSIKTNCKLISLITHKLEVTDEGSVYLIYFPYDNNTHKKYYYLEVILLEDNY